MDHLYIVLADLVLTASRSTKIPTPQDPNPNNIVFVTCTDTLTGKSHSVTMTDEELTNVLACAISNGGEGFTSEQYDKAAKAVQGFPVECRPVP